MHAEAAEPSPATAPDSQPLRCPDCGTTRTRAGNRFLNESDLLRHRRWHQKRAYFARAPLPPLLPNEAIPLGRTARMHRPDFVPAAPLGSAAPDPLQCPDCGATGSKRGETGRKFRNASDLAQHRKWCAHRPPDPAAEPIKCPDCGATGGVRGTKFRDPQDLLQHRKRCARPAAKAVPPAESSATAAHQNGTAPAPAPVAEHENGVATRRPALQVVRFCGGCGLDLKVLNVPVRFCPGCGLNLEAIATALNLSQEGPA